MISYDLPTVVPLRDKQTTMAIWPPTWMQTSLLQVENVFDGLHISERYSILYL